MSRRMLSLALLAAIGLPLIVGCQFLVFKVCVKNNTQFWLDEFTKKSAGAPTYPSGNLIKIAPGDKGFEGGYSAGDYDFRATFDVSDPEVCENIVELLGVTIENTNLCITFEVQDISGKSTCTQEIYATLDYVL